MGFGSRSIESVLVELFGVFSCFGDDCNRASDGDEIIVGIEFSDESFFLNFEGHGCFISFYFCDGVSGLYFGAFFDEPLENFSFFHGGGECWHLCGWGGTLRRSCLGSAKRAWSVSCRRVVC